MSKIIKEKRIIGFGNFQENEEIRLVWRNKHFRSFPTFAENKSVAVYSGDKAIFYGYFSGDSRCIVKIDEEFAFVDNNIVIPEEYFNAWENGDFSTY